ncbi:MULTISPECIES: DUF4190 domain-containing protein [unclassified Leifsonia]|uniref:DUF4190 domain-containing protein n=1 Tax=unclassified Leifsonia TaxID=2663824 RepID=UPI00147DA129|nr:MULTISPECIES: DUF4190 domain-containing protein [unclassified Leifsonia]
MTLALLAVAADTVSSALQFNTTDYLQALLLTVPFFVLAAASAVVVPATRKARTFALALLAGVFVVENVLANMHEFAPRSLRLAGPGDFWWVPPVLSLCLLTCAWLSLRARHGLAYLAAIPLRLALYGGVFALVSYGLAPAIYSGTGYNFGVAVPIVYGISAVLTLISWAVTAWVAALIDGAVRRRQGARSALNDPAGNPQLLTMRTNSLAIASLIVVFVSSLIGLILGYVALSQINRTGEQGRGLALSAVIIGWVSTGISVVLIIVAVTVGFSHSQPMVGG